MPMLVRDLLKALEGVDPATPVAILDPNGWLTEVHLAQPRKSLGSGWMFAVVLDAKAGSVEDATDD